MSIGDYSTYYSIPLSNFDTPTWVDEDWARWKLIDALIASIDDEAVPIVVATGSVNAFVATYNPAITAYTLGKVLSFIANNAVTGAATINVNGLGAKPLKMNGVDLIADDIPINSYVKIIYDGTNFAVIDPKKPVNVNQNIIVGSSGATANAATDFYVESSGPTYIEALGPNSSTQGYMFSRPTMSYAGGFKYDHVNGLAIVRVEGNDVWACDAAGFVTASKFIGPLQGSATGTAASWANSRTLTLGTDASGNVAFDGTADFTLNLTIVANSITNSKLADVATSTVKGRVTAGTGDPEDLTVTQLTTLVNAVVGATQSAAGTKGAVPAASAGDQHKVLSGAGSFEVGLGRAFGCVITTTNVNGSQPTFTNGRNVASISTLTVVGALSSCTITFTNALPNATYAAHVTTNGGPGSDTADATYGTKTTTTLAVYWGNAVGNPTEISVSGFA